MPRSPSADALRTVGVDPIARAKHWLVTDFKSGLLFLRREAFDDPAPGDEHGHEMGGSGAGFMRLRELECFDPAESSGWEAAAALMTRDGLVLSVGTGKVALAVLHLSPCK